MLKPREESVIDMAIVGVMSAVGAKAVMEVTGGDDNPFNETEIEEMIAISTVNNLKRREDCVK